MKNSTILITGAAGTVGAGLVRHYLAKDFVVRSLDNSEDALFRLDQSFREQPNFRPLFGDIRDTTRIDEAMDGVDYVIHCAACKHVYINEYSPSEAINTNIIGTSNVVRSSLRHGVKSVVLTSSDKAVNPTSTMGASKLLAERLVTAGNNMRGKNPTIFSSVRFGNIINSNGSVLTIFEKYAAQGMSLPITSPEMTRFFLRLEDAISLCDYAMTNAVGGEIFIKNMGSIKIKSLAKVFAKDYGVGLDVIGTKPGEKLYEELVTDTESSRTIERDEYLIVLPEIFSDFSGAVIEKIEEMYKLAHMSVGLRSDQDTLEEPYIRSLLA